jgi:hypothetical protein
MNSLVWIAQVLLAGIFLTTGTFKLFAFTPFIQALQERTRNAITLTPVQGKLIGFIEIVLAFGVLTPDVFTSNGLVPEFLIIRLSAAGLALLMVGAGIYHVRRQESAALNVSIFLLTLFVIVGRWPA